MGLPGIPKILEYLQQRTAGWRLKGARHTLYHTRGCWRWEKKRTSPFELLCLKVTHFDALGTLWSYTGKYVCGESPQGASSRSPDLLVLIGLLFVICLHLLLVFFFNWRLWKTQSAKGLPQEKPDVLALKKRPHQATDQNSLLFSCLFCFVSSLVALLWNGDSDVEKII